MTKLDEWLKKEWEIENQNLMHIWIRRVSYEGSHKKALKVIERFTNLLMEIDQHFSEWIIDPCGYDPKTEDRKNLIDTIGGMSEENEEMLDKLRSVISLDPEKL